MKEFHEQLRELLAQSNLQQQVLEELGDAIRETEAQLGRWIWLRQEALRKLHDALQELAEWLED